MPYQNHAFARGVRRDDIGDPSHPDLAAHRMGVAAGLSYPEEAMETVDG